MSNKEIIKQYLKLQKDVEVLRKDLLEWYKWLKFELTHSEIKENWDDVYLTFSIKFEYIDIMTNDFVKYLEPITSNENLASKMVFNKDSAEILVRTK